VLQDPVLANILSDEGSLQPVLEAWAKGWVKPAAA